MFRSWWLTLLILGIAMSVVLSADHGKPGHSEDEHDEDEHDEEPEHHEDEQNPDEEETEDEEKDDEKPEEDSDDDQEDESQGDDEGEDDNDQSHLEHDAFLGKYIHTYLLNTSALQAFQSSIKLKKANILMYNY